MEQLVKNIVLIQASEFELNELIVIYDIKIFYNRNFSSYQSLVFTKQLMNDLRLQKMY